MGLLDDAIREHLDLKRRRGADPAEIARAEQDALGPVRREPASAEAAEAPHDEPAAGAAEAPAAEPPRERAPEPESAPAEPEPPAPEPAPEPAAEAPPADPRHSDIVHQPTTEFRVEDHHEDDAPRGGTDHDVLEDTPDFLEETPEHDRLWFEQRPPRDFDFDG